MPSPATQKGGSGQQQSSQMIDLATYYIGAGSAVGSVTFQELMPDGVTWVGLTTPAVITLGAAAFNNVINGPFLGLRMAVVVSVAAIPQLLLKGSIRSL
jgi:hypothetical protein